MILTIQCPTARDFRAGVFQADVILGLDTETYEDNTFEIAVHDKVKVNSVLSKCNGKVVAQYDSRIVR